MKKIIGVIVGSVRALPDVATKVTAPTVTTGTTGIYDCQGTLRSGYGFVTKEFFAEYDTTAAKEAATGIACDKPTPTSGDCSNAFQGAASTITADHKLSSDFTDK